MTRSLYNLSFEFSQRESSHIEGYYLYYVKFFYPLGESESLTDI
jgi:hypothetical protein